eukprot:m.114687 g.114687  ORF g.114687 m.114687 type:complete len:868 (+) comp10853_c0_seq2:264-2867(+)
MMGRRAVCLAGAAVLMAAPVMGQSIPGTFVVDLVGGGGEGFMDGNAFNNTAILFVVNDNTAIAGKPHHVVSSSGELNTSCATHCAAHVDCAGIVVYQPSGSVIPECLGLSTVGGTPMPCPPSWTLCRSYSYTGPQATAAPTVAGGTNTASASDDNDDPPLPVFVGWVVAAFIALVLLVVVGVMYAQHREEERKRKMSPDVRLSALLRDIDGRRPTELARITPTRDPFVGLASDEGHSFLEEDDTSWLSTSHGAPRDFSDDSFKNRPKKPAGGGSGGGVAMPTTTHHTQAADPYVAPVDIVNLRGSLDMSAISALTEDTTSTTAETLTMGTWMVSAGAADDDDDEPIHRMRTSFPEDAAATPEQYPIGERPLPHTRSSDGYARPSSRPSRVGLDMEMMMQLTAELPHSDRPQSGIEAGRMRMLQVPPETGSLRPASAPATGKNRRFRTHSESPASVGSPVTPDEFSPLSYGEAWTRPETASTSDSRTDIEHSPYPESDVAGRTSISPRERLRLLTVTTASSPPRRMTSSSSMSALARLREEAMEATAGGQAATAEQKPHTPQRSASARVRGNRPRSVSMVSYFEDSDRWLAPSGRSSQLDIRMDVSDIDHDMSMYGRRREYEEENFTTADAEPSRRESMFFFEESLPTTTVDEPTPPLERRRTVGVDVANIRALTQSDDDSDVIPPSPNTPILPRRFSSWEFDAPADRMGSGNIPEDEATEPAPDAHDMSSISEEGATDAGTSVSGSATGSSSRTRATTDSAGGGARTSASGSRRSGAGAAGGYNDDDDSDEADTKPFVLLPAPKRRPSFGSRTSTISGPMSGSAPSSTGEAAGKEPYERLEDDSPVEEQEGDDEDDDSVSEHEQEIV